MRVEDKCQGTLTGLIDDIDTQDIIVLNLERAVQACVDIGAYIIAGFDEITMPASMSDIFLTLKNVKVIDEELAEHLTKAVGFKNTAIHSSQDIS